eukprot:362835-Chlamydomonas_euryale.AAC.3
MATGKNASKTSSLLQPCPYGSAQGWWLLLLAPDISLPKAHLLSLRGRRHWRRRPWPPALEPRPPAQSRFLSPTQCALLLLKPRLGPQCAAARKIWHHGFACHVALRPFCRRVAQTVAVFAWSLSVSLSQHSQWGHDGTGQD